MFKKKTLFIVGAGASHEFGLPIGLELAGAVAQLLNAQRQSNVLGGETLLLKQLQRSDAANAPAYYPACRLICDGVRPTTS
jgi:hypothetical protein